MKQLSTLLLIVLILTSCNSDTSAEKSDETISDTLPKITSVTSYVSFYNVNETTINTDNLSARQLVDYHNDLYHHISMPNQDYTSLPFYDDFSDKEFTNKYMGEGTYSSIWAVDSGRLTVDNYFDDSPAGITIGNFGWQNYIASIDFNISQNNYFKMWVYVRVSGDFDSDNYAIQINSDGSYHAGNSGGMHSYKFSDYIGDGDNTLITGVFEDFDPSVWNRVYMISYQGKLYISLNSAESIYICDIDPNAAGAIRLEASTDVFDPVK
jgi:hypothetical protein